MINHAIGTSGTARCGSTDKPRVGGVTCPKCRTLINAHSTERPYHGEPVILPCIETKAGRHDHTLSVEEPDVDEPDDAVCLVVDVAGHATASIVVNRDDLIRALGGTP